jgi:hypothetical protein
MAVKPIPEGYHTLTPYLVVRGADKTIEFLKKAFGAELSFEPMMRPDGKVMHADLKIGDSHVMISEEMDKHPAMPCMVHVYVPNVDAVYQRAVSAGAGMRIVGYVKQVGVEPPYRLTNDPAMNYGPAWSPDGRLIAFLRDISPSKTAIILIPQRGGSERILAEVNGSLQSIAYGPYLSWTPDSKWLAYTRIGMTNMQSVYVYSTDQKKSFPVTDGFVDAVALVGPKERIRDRRSPMTGCGSHRIVFEAVHPVEQHIVDFGLAVRRDVVLHLRLHSSLKASQAVLRSAHRRVGQQLEPGLSQSGGNRDRRTIRRLRFDGARTPSQQRCGLAWASGQNGRTGQRDYALGRRQQASDDA